MGKGSFAYAWVLDETGEERTRLVLTGKVYMYIALCIGPHVYTSIIIKTRLHVYEYCIVGFFLGVYFTNETPCSISPNLYL